MYSNLFNIYGKHLSCNYWRTPKLYLVNHSQIVSGTSQSAIRHIYSIGHTKKLFVTSHDPFVNFEHCQAYSMSLYGIIKIQYLQHSSLALSLSLLRSRAHIKIYRENSKICQSYSKNQFGIFYISIFDVPKSIISYLFFSKNAASIL